MRGDEATLGLPASFPRNNEAEEAVLGCMMWDMSGLYELHGRRLKDDLWLNELNRVVAHACIDMHVSGLEVNAVTVTEWLRKAGTLDGLGGAAKMVAFCTTLPSMTGVLAGMYLDMLEDMEGRRMLLRQADALKLAACNYTQSWKDALLQAEAALFDVHAKTSHEGLVHVSKVVPTVVEEIEQTVMRKGHVTNGVATGFTTLDRMTMGLKAGVHVIAARPSMGKTALLMQAALQVSMGTGDYPEFDQPPLPVAIYSLETDLVALVKRGLLNLAALNLQRIRDGNISRGDMQALVEQAKKLSRANMFIEANFSLSIQDFRSRLRMQVKRHGIRIVFIDYLQLMSSSTKRAKENRNMEIAEISLGLKNAALELKIPIVVLAQLNRDGDVPRPKLSHLRECGQIEQDADSVSMICQAPDWVSEKDPEDAPWTYMGLDIVKQKDGPTTTGVDPVILRFDKEFFRLTSVDEKLFSNNPEQRQQHGPREKVDVTTKEKRGRGRPRKETGPDATLAGICGDD